MRKSLSCAVLVLCFVSSVAFAQMEMNHTTNTITPGDGIMTIAGALNVDSISAAIVPFSFAIGTTDASVGTTEADMPEMFVSVISDGSPIFIRIWIAYEPDINPHDTTFRLYRDATEIRKWRDNADVMGQSETTALHWVDQPSEGIYIYKVTWQADSQTTVRNASSDGFHGSIISIELINR